MRLWMVFDYPIIILYDIFGRQRHNWLNTDAWVVEFTYMDLVVKCESLLGDHGVARCTVKEDTLNLTLSRKVILVRGVKQLIRLPFMLGI